MSKMFESAIKKYLDGRAASDPAFAEKYRSEKKSVADCCRFIIAEVRKSCKGNEAACTDDCVYGLAMHYYDEESIKAPAGVPACSVVVPGSVELTEEDRAEARKEARAEALRRLREEEVQEQMRKERRKKEAAEKKAEAERRRNEERLEKMRREEESMGVLFDFNDGEDVR